MILIYFIPYLMDEYLLQNWSQLGILVNTKAHRNMSLKFYPVYCFPSSLTKQKHTSLILSSAMPAHNV